MAIQNSTNTIIVSYGNGSMTFDKSLSSVESTATTVKLYQNSNISPLTTVWDESRAKADGFDSLSDLLEYLNDAIGGGTGTILASGTATMSGGIANVLTSRVRSTSRIFCSRRTLTADAGHLYANDADIVDGESFIIRSTSFTDTSTFGYQDVDLGGGVDAIDATGLANDATEYTATATVDGIAIPITIVGSAAQTYNDLLTELNTIFGVGAYASIEGGNLRIASDISGDASTVLIEDTDLFSSLSDFVSITAAVDGETTSTGEESTINWWITEG